MINHWATFTGAAMLCIAFFVGWLLVSETVEHLNAREAERQRRKRLAKDLLRSGLVKQSGDKAEVL